jgi:phosphoribosylanthranilate isomerase
MLIKVCGVTTPEDARMIAEAGADAIGINFWNGSRRFVGASAADVVAAIPAGVLKFGVFVNAPVAEVLRLADQYHLDRIQLHGDERAVDFSQVPPARLVRAVRVRGVASLGEMAHWAAELFLLDAFVDGYGGGGVTAPWSDIASHRAAVDPAGSGPRFLIAGGLHPGNVAEAIRTTRPAGVDVASGVEDAPGKKNARLVEAFITAARSATSLVPGAD